MISKEFGSDFHYVHDNVALKSVPHFMNIGIEYFFSGRVALYNLLQYGYEKYGWKKVGFPSYYCHEVVDYCKGLPLDIVYYDYRPFHQDKAIDWEDTKENVFINVDFFGVSKLDCSFLKYSVVIEDLTHNLLSFNQSNADYCFGSLRKQLPLAVGGFGWSKRGDFEIDTHENTFSTKVALQKLTAMYLKGEYLTNGFPDKNVFRTLFVDAEEQFANHLTNVSLPKVVKAQLDDLNPEKLISKTRDNITYAKNLLIPSAGISLMGRSRLTEMGLMFLCGNQELRDRFRKHLIEHSIFPAILWPDQVQEKDMEFQNRVLFVHADFRYSQNDIAHIVSIINKFIKHV